MVTLASGDPFIQGATRAPNKTENWDSTELSQDVLGLSAVCQWILMYS